MSIYLSAETLAEAVGRLQASSAKSRLVDYLILRRALVLGAEDDAERADMLAGQVTLSMKDTVFMQSMYEMAAATRTPASDAAAPESVFDAEALAQSTAGGWQGQPYFQVLGTAGETEHGYRTRKYRSNGTADTVTKGIFIQRGLVEIVPNTRPREVRLGPGNTPEVIAEVFLGSGAKPRLDDFAAWWFRSTDLEAHFGPTPTVEDLASAVVSDLGLSAEEVTALFGDGEEDAEALPEEAPGE